MEMRSKYLNPLCILIGVGRRAEALQARRTKNKRYTNAKAFISHASLPLKVNVGCGQEPFQGWLNLDLDPGTKADFLWDITDGLPFDNDSCAFIYSEHFLEHLLIQDGVRFLAECYRSLQRGGVLRIGMPSLQEIVRQYYENDWANKPWLEKYGYAWIKTRAECINVSFREWGHQWLYDAEELDRRLKEVGFTRIESVKWGYSEYSEVRNRETREETLLIFEATK